MALFIQRDFLLDSTSAEAPPVPGFTLLSGRITEDKVQFYIYRDKIFRRFIFSQRHAAGGREGKREGGRKRRSGRLLM